MNFVWGIGGHAHAKVYNKGGMRDDLIHSKVVGINYFYIDTDTSLIIYISIHTDSRN